VEGRVLCSAIKLSEVRAVLGDTTVAVYERVDLGDESTIRLLADADTGQSAMYRSVISRERHASCSPILRVGWAQMCLEHRQDSDQAGRLTEFT
jgi:hypothetical protein